MSSVRLLPRGASPLPLASATHKTYLQYMPAFLSLSLSSAALAHSLQPAVPPHWQGCQRHQRTHTLGAPPLDKKASVKRHLSPQDHSQFSSSLHNRSTYSPCAPLEHLSPAPHCQDSHQDTHSPLSVVGGPRSLSALATALESGALDNLERLI